MVMMSSTLRGRAVKFQTDALPPRTVEVLSVTGSERISTPFRFEVNLVSKSADLDATAILKQPAFIGVKQGIPISGGMRGIQTLKWYGMIASFEQGDKKRDWISYRAILVPRLWRLSLNIQSRVFLDQGVPEIVEQVLNDTGFGSEDYEFRTGRRTYPRREYVVQYQESDLAFLSRLLEYEGLSYWFEHGDQREKIVFGDSPTSFRPIPGVDTFRYAPEDTRATKDGPDWFEEETIQSLLLRQDVIQSEVALKDYNYRIPSVPLHSSAPVVPEGMGRLYEYGSHHKDQEEGKVYAALRAEEIKCRQKTLKGKGGVRSFSAGAIYRLTDHYRSGFNGEYVITEVKHKVEQAIDLTQEGGRATANYENEFTSIPAEVAFRPPRETPKPKITGVMHAKIDAAGDGKYAEIDKEGRYKVCLPFDLSGRDKGKATRWIRMAQPYSGPNFGFHFPLHKGSEVVLIHIDGDPDRPIISAAVPNPETGSPVKGENHSQCVIRTGAGNQIVIEDTEGSERVALSSPHSKTSISIGSSA